MLPSDRTGLLADRRISEGKAEETIRLQLQSTLQTICAKQKVVASVVAGRPGVVDDAKLQDARLPLLGGEVL